MHLLTLLPFASALASALPQYTTPATSTASCNYTGVNQPVFYLPTVKYSSQIIYSTPAHLAVSSATIDFGLVNSAYSTNLSCTAYSGGQQSSGAFFAYPSTSACTFAGRGLGGAGPANFTWTLYDKQASIKETWGCGGHDYLGTATKTLDLQCETTKWQNANWTMGQQYSSEIVTCEPLSVFIVPEVVQLD